MGYCIAVMKWSSGYCASAISMLLLCLCLYNIAPGRCQRNPDYSVIPKSRLLAGNFWPSVEIVNFLTTPTYTQSEWYTCPNGTYYAVDRANLPASIPVDQFPEMHQRILGCIPPNHHACLPPRSLRMVGSCPMDTFCVYQERRTTGDALVKFAGCVEDYARDCNGLICPRGYTCCPSPVVGEEFCVPHAGDPHDLDAVCGRKVTINSSPANAMLADRLPGRVAYLPKGQPMKDSELYVQVQGFNVTADLVLVPQQYRDYLFNRCHIDDLVAVFPYPVQFDNTTNTFTFEPFLRDCCPPDTNHCHAAATDGNVFEMEKTAVVFVGCADPLYNEVCCGFSICSDGHKCCSFFPAIAPSNDTNADPPSVEARETICCPEGTQCCYGNPALIELAGEYPSETTSFRNSPLNRAFCGRPIGGVDCAMDALAPPLSYLLTARRTQADLFGVISV